MKLLNSWTDWKWLPTNGGTLCKWDKLTLMILFKPAPPLQGCHKSLVSQFGKFEIWTRRRPMHYRVEPLATGSVWPIFWIICHQRRRAAAAIFHRSLALGVALARRRGSKFGGEKALNLLLPDHSFMLRTITARKVSNVFFWPFASFGRKRLPVSIPTMFFMVLTILK